MVGLVVGGGLARLRVAALSCALLAAGCPDGSGGGSPSPGPDDLYGPGRWVAAGEAVVGPDGALVASDDGVLRASFPAGAVAEPLTVRVERFEPADGPAPAAPALALRVDAMLPVAGTLYRLEPAGARTLQPFLVSVAFDPDTVPVPLEAEDLGLYDDRGGDWAVAPDGWVDNLQLPPPGSAHRAGAMVQELGAWLVGVHPPYAAPPALDEIRNGLTVLSTPSGPRRPSAPGGILELVGSGFGWDEAVVEVLVDGEEVEISDLTNRRISAALAWGPPPAELDQRTVRVRVLGVASNSLTLQVEGATPCEGRIDQLANTVAAPGMTVTLDGALCGTAETRRILLGDRPLVPTATGIDGRYVVTIPDDAPPGPTTLRTLDGLGSPPGPAVDFMVLPTGPVGLGPGLEAGGVRLVASRASEPGYVLALDVANLEPPFEAWDGNSLRQGVVDVRFTTPQGETVFPDARPSCWGLPSGPCYLELPFSLLEPLPAGASLGVSLRVTQRVGEANTPGGLYVRDSNTVPLEVLERAPAGSYKWVNVGQDGPGYDLFCWSADALLAVGDHVCLYVDGAGDPAQPDPCLASLHRLSAPGLFEGERDFGWCGLREHCFPVDEPGTYEVHNQTLGRTCPIVVQKAPGFGSGTATFDPAQGVVIAAGGARVHIPPGALPPRPGGEPYGIEAFATPDPQSSATDPQQAWDIAYGFQLTPDVEELLAPVSVSLPFEPAGAPGGKPAFGLIEPDTGFTHLVEEGVALVLDALVWQLPAGTYRADPAPGQPPPVLPASLNKVTLKMGVLYRKAAPGQIEDAMGRVRVEYVTDPTSDDYVTEIYAAAVLDGAVQAWELLDGLGWNMPDHTVQVLVRKKVSWADFSGQASGATTSGFLGQPVSVIKSTLATEAEVVYVAIHELAHVVQREYTTNVTLSWLDEGMSEWTAWKVLGEDFPQNGLTEDGAGALVPTLGLPDSWGGYPKDLVYGTSPWLMWMSHAHGDEAVRRLYEALDGDPLKWASVHATFAEALGTPAFVAAGQFAEAFWAQSFPPLDEFPLAAVLSVVATATTTLQEAKQLSLPLAARPPLSSLRYGVRVPAAVEQAALDGEVVLRAGTLDPFRRLTVLHQGSLGIELADATVEAVLDATAPVAVLPALVGGTYWVIDNHRDTVAAPASTFELELPRLSSAAPSPAAAGQTVKVTGQELGFSKGTLTVGGQDVVPASWAPTSVTFVMPDFPNTSAVTVVARTAETARTNAILLPVATPP